MMEHLDRSAETRRELSRVNRGDLVGSVPSERFVRLGSLTRGNYVRGLGNHPAHVNHWNRRSLPAFLRSQVDVADVAVAFPWLIARCHVR
jgi:hypothetical protein